LLLSGVWLTFWRTQPKNGKLLGLLGFTISLVGLSLAGSRYGEILAAGNGAEAEMKSAFGPNYTGAITVELARTQRHDFFNFFDYFKGINFKAGEVNLTSDITYRIVEGKALGMDVYRPAAALPDTLGPALVVIHGGGWQSGDKTELSELNYYMASRGWTVFSLNYRLLPQYPFPAATEDVQCALAYINQNGKNYGADVNRMAVLGRSAGGTMALTVAYMPNPIASAASCGPLPALRAVVNYYGESEMVSWYEKEGGASLTVPYLGGIPQQQPENYRLASPLTYVNRPLPPTLILHGDKDTVVQIEQSLKLVPRLKESSTPVAIVRIPWTGHAFDLWTDGPSNQIALYYTERFLNYTTALK
jgi:acetyl esterase/lipase